MGFGGAVMGVLWGWDDLYRWWGGCFRVYMAPEGVVYGLYGAGKSTGLRAGPAWGCLLPVC